MVSETRQLKIALFWYTADQLVHWYRADRLIEPGWVSLIPLCMESAPFPDYHSRENVAVHYAADALQCLACATWKPRDPDLKLTVVAYTPPARLAIYRATRGEVRGWDTETLHAHGCRFCLATYSEITHMDQCERGHRDIISS